MTQQPIGFLKPGQVAIDKEELKELRRKAEAHDAFVEALREMGRRQLVWMTPAKEGNEFARGWLRSLREMADLVVKRREG